MINSCIFYNDGHIEFALDKYRQDPNIREIHIEAGNVVSSLVDPNKNLIVEHVNSKTAVLGTSGASQEYPISLLTLKDPMTKAGLLPFVLPDGPRFRMWDTAIFTDDNSEKQSECRFARFSKFQIEYADRDPDSYQNIVWVNSLLLAEPEVIFTTPDPTPMPFIEPGVGPTIEQQIASLKGAGVPDVKKPQGFSEFGTQKIALIVVGLFGVAYVMEQ